MAIRKFEFYYQGKDKHQNQVEWLEMFSYEQKVTGSKVLFSQLMTEKLSLSTLL